MNFEENIVEQPEVRSTTVDCKYAGFWMRFAAAFIDSAILSIVGILFLPILYLLGVVSALFGAGFGALVAGSNGAAVSALITGSIIVFLSIVMVNWLYFALMEHSKLQATLGKLALGIIVVDQDGHRITFDRATRRYFAKYLSTIICFIGFIMSGFTEKKQTLHDIIAGCLVIEKPSGPR